MAVSASFLTFLLDQLDGVPQLRTKRMFGGIGLYSGEYFLGAVLDDTPYLRVDDETRAEFVKLGMVPFHPSKKRPKLVMANYYQLPSEVLEDTEKLGAWARRAIVAAQHANAAKRKRASGTAARKRARS